jgi:hypothetical protein
LGAALPRHCAGRIKPPERWTTTRSGASRSSNKYKQTPPAEMSTITQRWTVPSATKLAPLIREVRGARRRSKGKIFFKDGPVLTGWTPSS